jgi:hypothetical protein
MRSGLLPQSTTHPEIFGPERLPVLHYSLKYTMLYSTGWHVYRGAVRVGTWLAPRVPSRFPTLTSQELGPQVLRIIDRESPEVLLCVPACLVETVSDIPVSQKGPGGTKLGMQDREHGLPYCMPHFQSMAACYSYG